jgi:3-deoxy-D-manno-octulosonate 8-phosphate phosphatase (KDO 8-P phosphatase)
MNLRRRAAIIKMVCTDVDGVLTSGFLQYGPLDGHWKQFHVRDGAGAKALQKAGIRVAMISGLDSPATSQRARDLGIEDCMTGAADKVSIIMGLSEKYGIPLGEIAYIGDDLIDLGALGIVGLAICPQDAALEAKKIAHWVAPVDGGNGVLRAVAEFILKPKGQWDEIVDSYLKQQK